MTTVFIFLLDYFPGFEDAFNSSFIYQENSSINSINKCNPLVSDVVWQEITRNIKKMGEHFGHNKSNSDKIGPVPKINYLNKPAALRNDYTTSRELLDLNTNKFHSMQPREDFPANSPFLVAIFETILNITAQTCGGVLLTSNWVLTAGFCVDVLSHIDTIHTNSSKSYHTIIANSLNPLADGTVHNVLDILHLKRKKHNTDVPYISLMNIKPGAGIQPLRLFRSTNVIGLDVMVHGWTVYKFANGTDVMEAASFRAKTFNSNQCHATNISFVECTLLCLYPDDKINENVTQINSGGPVFVLRRNKPHLLGIVLIDRQRLFVIPINQYVQGIKNIISQ